MHVTIHVGFIYSDDERNSPCTVMCFAFSNFNKGLQYDSFINENSDQICTLIHYFYSVKFEDKFILESINTLVKW